MEGEGTKPKGSLISPNLPVSEVILQPSGQGEAVNVLLVVFSWKINSSCSVEVETMAEYLFLPSPLYSTK